MFTGLIQKTGTVVDVQRADDSGHLVVDTKPWKYPLELGESISVQGVCLTLTHHSASEEDSVRIAFDILGETFARSSLADLEAGSILNLERALRVGDALGGHIVNGHIDGVGHVAGIVEKDNDHIVTIECDQALMGGIIEKGCIAVDGISLTVAKLDADWFTVHVIPHTWRETSFAQLEKNAKVNLEIDVVAKYVLRSLKAKILPQPLTWNALSDLID